MLEVAATTGVSARALRYYEEQGLLTSVRSASGQRHYAQGVVERVRWIQALYAAGLGSKVLVELLPCVHTGVATPEMVERLRTERARIKAQARELHATLGRLDAAIAKAAGSRTYEAPEGTLSCTAPGHAGGSQGVGRTSGAVGRRCGGCTFEAMTGSKGWRRGLIAFSVQVGADPLVARRALVAIHRIASRGPAGG